MSHNSKFEKLLEPGRIGSVKTRNRIIKSAAGLNFWAAGDNPVGPKALYLHDAFARGGVGLLIVDSPSMDQAGRGYQLVGDKGIKQLSELTGLVHRSGCPVFVQLAHYANWRVAKLPYAKERRGASPVYNPTEMDNHNAMPREMTVAEIEEITEKFVNHAEAARKAGFDGVEINAASSHLLNSFLSPFWNKRQDQYGGNLENRTRFVVEIIKGMKKRIGQDYPVSLIINGLEIGKLIGVKSAECLSLSDSIKIAKILENAGADSIQIRSNWIGRHDSSFLIDHLFYPETPIPFKEFPPEMDWSRRGAGANAPLAEAVKREISIPVIIVGRLDPILGEKILTEGKADFIAMTRRLFADPELPNKLASGKFNDIAPCSSCTQCKDEDGPRRCRINATMGTEKQYKMESPAEKKKKVVVVGGGPGGMEAARVAASRGHKVILYEKANKLGGLLPLAAMVKGTEIENLPAFVQYLKEQITKLGVEIRLGMEFGASLIDEIKPDVVILATGGKPVVPNIPGINSRKVVNGANLHKMLKFYLKFLSPGTLRWLSQFWMPLGKKIIVIGGDIQGCELAEFLVKRGRQVTIVDSADELGKGMINHLKMQLFWWFDKKGVILMPGVQPVAITEKGLTVLNKLGYKPTIVADTIVTAMPMQPDTELMGSLKGKVPEVYAIGDCNNPALIVDAVADGWKIANSI